MNRRYSYAFFISIVMLFQIGCDFSSRDDSSSAITNTADEDSASQIPEERKILTEDDIFLRKAFQYNQYTLDDEYPYQDTVRYFQWEKIKKEIAHIETQLPTVETGAF